MIRNIVLTLIMLLPMRSNAQDILKTKLVLPTITVKDELFFNQLDSILFIQHPCRETPTNTKHAFFASIEEKENQSYIIDVIYAKPSLAENYNYKGFCKIRDVYLLINENSEKFLFEVTNDRGNFIYEKQIFKRSDRTYFQEFEHPEEVCRWLLEYKDKKLEILDLELVKNSHRNKTNTN